MMAYDFGKGRKWIIPCCFDGLIFSQVANLSINLDKMVIVKNRHAPSGEIVSRETILNILRTWPVVTDPKRLRKLREKFAPTKNVAFFADQPF